MEVSTEVYTRDIIRAWDSFDTLPKLSFQDVVRNYDAKDVDMEASGDGDAPFTPLPVSYYIAVAYGYIKEWETTFFVPDDLRLVPFSSNGENVYLMASYMGDIPTMKYLKGQPGFDPDVRNKHGSNAYLIAACNGQLDVMKYLMGQPGFDPNVRNKYGSNAYLRAAYNGQLDVMKYLMGQPGFDPDVRNKYGSNAYLLAAYNGQLDTMKYLKGQPGFDPDVRNKYGDNAYLIAAYNGQPDTMKYLKGQPGFDPDVRNKYGDNAFDLACSKQRVKICDILFARMSNLMKMTRSYKPGMVKHAIRADAASKLVPWMRGVLYRHRFIHTIPIFVEWWFSPGNPGAKSSRAHFMDALDDL